MQKDVFCEYMVKRKPGGLILLVKSCLSAVFCILTLTCIISLFLSLRSLLLLLPLWVVVLVTVYYTVTSLNVEFEYSVTNGEMDIDMIIARRRRSRRITFRLESVEAFGRYRWQDHSRHRYQHTVMACDHPTSPNLWYCVARVPQRGSTLVVFNANSSLLAAIRQFLKPEIAAPAFEAEGFPHTDG